MMRQPPLKALRVFQIAVEQGSFKQAAEMLNVTQAAVSQQIRQLESFYGEALFVRLTREVQPTAAALRLLPYLQQAFRLIDEGTLALTADPHPDQLKITTIASFASRWLIPRLGGFQAQHPALGCFISTSNLRHDFRDGSQDLAIRFGTGAGSGTSDIAGEHLKAQKIADDYIVPLCHPQLLTQLEMGVVTLQDLPLLLDESEDMQQVNAGFRQLLGGKNRVALQMQDANILIDAALSGQGLSPMRFSLAYEQIQRGQLVCPLPHYWQAPFSYYLMAPEQHFSRPKVEAFAQWISGEITIIEQEWQRFLQARPLQMITSD